MKSYRNDRIWGRFLSPISTPTVEGENRASPEDKEIRPRSLGLAGAGIYLAATQNRKI